MSDRRVVITGMGWVTSLGDSVDEVWQSLTQGASGIGPITRFDTDRFTTKIGGQISTDWSPPHIEKRELKRVDRFTAYALSATINAVNDSGLDFEKEDLWRCGSIIGTGIGGIEEFETGSMKLIEKGPERVSPFTIPKLMCNAAAGNVSIRYGLKGPNSAITTACASAAHAIGEAAHSIRHGVSDIMITGGAEAAVTPLGVAAFIALKALSKRNDDPTKASRPFDADRDGFVLAEGAGIIILEEYEHAKARGANIYAEVRGFGQTADGSHITAPDEQGRGAAHAMELAVKDAGVNLEAIQYINAHGTSTGLGDIAETRAVKSLFKDHAKRLAVSSTKSMTGHLLGASGGVEAIIVAKTIETGVILPTINLDNPDDECDLDFVPNTARQSAVDIAMSNSFGFGGHNVSLVLGKL